MSSALAIAGVTQVLRDLLNDGIVNNDVAAAVGAAVSIRALPPDRLQTLVTDTTPTLNMFLHRVTPNAGWANQDLPGRDHRGNRLRRPLLALDLHYLLTAFGYDELHAEILLGYAMRTLHENPVLSRAQITRALNPVPPLNGGFPPALEALDRSGLADQIEQVKITADYLSTEEMTRIWSAMLTQYRPTTAYRATVVLIESDLPSRVPRPVLTIGADNRGAMVSPSLLSPLPIITRVILPARQPSVRLGESLVVEGRNLDGVTVQGLLRHARLAVPVTLNPDPGGTATIVGFSIANTPANAAAFAAGPVQISLLVQRPGEPAPRETNGWPLMLAPLPDFAAATVVPGAGQITVDLPVRPAVRAGQEVSLVIGDAVAPALPLVGPTSLLPRFQFGNLAPGAYLAWLRVDGVDSWFTLRDLPPIAPDFAPRPPAFDPAASLVVPV
jgi:hypothetical protein